MLVILLTLMCDCVPVFGWVTFCKQYSVVLCLFWRKGLIMTKKCTIFEYTEIYISKHGLKDSFVPCSALLVQHDDCRVSLLLYWPSSYVKSIHNQDPSVENSVQH
jgi:hypothetical protein